MPPITDFYPIPTFSSVEDTLLHRYIDTILVNLECPPPSFQSRNGHRYVAVYDNVHPSKTKPVISAVVSFQRHTYGNFAIVREQTEKEYND